MAAHRRAPPTPQWRRPALSAAERVGHKRREPGVSGSPIPKPNLCDPRNLRMTIIQS
jgi:hypothetical protein